MKTERVWQVVKPSKRTNGTNVSDVMSHGENMRGTHVTAASFKALLKPQQVIFMVVFLHLRTQ